MSGMDDEPGHFGAVSASAAPVHEKKLGRMGKIRKAAWRSLFGTIMMAVFGGIIHLGHAYVCLMVFMFQCMIFGELVGVRKKLAAEKKLPLFRSIQWAWFLVAAFFTWSDGAYAFLREHPMRFRRAWASGLQRIILEKSTMISFCLYSALVMVSVLSLRKGLYRYQFTQYSWTLMTCCIVVFQMRAAFQMIYAGLFWFVLPCSLVICNDIMAYFNGVTLGGRLIRRPLLELSPNKTWEGFLGSAVCTVIFAFWFSGFLSQLQWAICIPEDITFELRPLACEPAPMYRPQALRVLAEDTSLGLLSSLLRLLGPRLAEGEVCVAQIHGVLLALFASVVAPFGGFLASAIKRTYGIKDFNKLIPGHGGLMDRFDCQFIMCMCSYVYHFTFCRETHLSVDALLAAASLLRPEERRVLLERLRLQTEAERGMDGPLT